MLSTIQVQNFCCTLFDLEINTVVLNATTDYILPTERLEEPLF